PSAAASPAPGAGMTSLSEALGRPVDYGWAVERFCRGFSESFGVSLEPLVLGPEDRASIAELCESRYATDAWTFRS
ncbi:MAG: hypothetical protein ACXVI6_03325, partial [Candidatus Aminicenantales bacterium]